VLKVRKESASRCERSSPRLEGQGGAFYRGWQNEAAERNKWSEAAEAGSFMKQRKFLTERMFLNYKL